MGILSTVDRARNIAQEVASYRPDYDAQRAPIAEDLNFIWDTFDPEDVADRRLLIGRLAYAALEQSHEVIRLADEYMRPIGRASTVTRKTLSMTAPANTSLQPMIHEVLDDSCLGAELKFIHSLAHHELHKTLRPRHAAALILYDAAGEPLAYQKAIGEHSAYVLRDGLLQTRAGQKLLFAGSIVQPIYSNEGDAAPPPQEEFAGHGVVGITGCAADDVEFKRLSLEFLPQKIRRGALLDASSPGAYEEFYRYANEATAMNAAGFAEHIVALAKETRNYHIA